MALPSASERKSYTLTSVASPVACHSAPLFLNWPSNSFFLQSTEMIGLPCCSNTWHVVWMCSNCASRSGCEVPSMFFLFARKEYPRARKILRIVVSATSCPIRSNASFRWATLLVVHLSRLIGSPLGSSRLSRSASRLASFSTACFLPPRAVGPLGYSARLLLLLVCRVGPYFVKPSPLVRPGLLTLAPAHVMRNEISTSRRRSRKRISTHAMRNELYRSLRSGFRSFCVPSVVGHRSD